MGFIRIKKCTDGCQSRAILKVPNMEWGDDIPGNWRFIEEDQMKSWVDECNAQVALTMGAVYLEQFFIILLS